MRWSFRVKRHTRTPYRSRVLGISVFNSRYRHLACAGFTKRRADAWGLRWVFFRRRVLYRRALNSKLSRLPSLLLDTVQFGFVSAFRLYRIFFFVFSNLVWRTTIASFALLSGCGLLGTLQACRRGLLPLGLLRGRIRRIRRTRRGRFFLRLFTV